MKSHYHSAATILLNNRIAKSKKVRLPLPHRPETSEQALQIQAELIKLRDDKIAGWKCSLPLKDDQFVVAPLFSSTVQSGEQCLLFADNGKARVEPEIAFLLGADLPARSTGYSEAEIDLAVASCHMALELIQDRLGDESHAPFYEKLADCLANQGVYIGPQIDKSQAYCANEFGILINQGENTQRFAGLHPNKLPQKPLHWLINFMTRRGIGFTAGEIIITGSYAGVIDLQFNIQTEIEYQGLGRYQVTFLENKCI